MGGCCDRLKGQIQGLGVVTQTEWTVRREGRWGGGGHTD